MRILERTGHGVLWLLGENDTAIKHLRREAQLRNLDPARLIFAPPVPLAEHLSRLRAADLVVDTLPFNAHTTASDALWAGVPVVTRIGRSFAARVAASLLNGIGLAEFITVTEEEYVAMAVKLANDSSLMAQAKQKLRENRLTTPLFDTELFTRHIEDAYTTMYERHHAGLNPDDIHVSRRTSAAPGTE